MCKVLFVIMCYFFRITDKLSFDVLSILILDKLCMNLLCLQVFSLVLVLINLSYFSNVTT